MNLTLRVVLPVGILKTTQAAPFIIINAASCAGVRFKVLFIKILSPPVSPIGGTLQLLLLLLLIVTEAFKKAGLLLLILMLLLPLLLLPLLLLLQQGLMPQGEVEAKGLGFDVCGFG